jgi:hypothetical protein
MATILSFYLVVEVNGKSLRLAGGIALFLSCRTTTLRVKGAETSV